MLYAFHVSLGVLLFVTLYHDVAVYLFFPLFLGNCGHHLLLKCCEVHKHINRQTVCVCAHICSFLYGRRRAQKSRFWYTFVHETCVCPV